jgi:hypothetical protein
MNCRDRPEDNYLIATLPTADFDRVLPNLERISLELGQVLAGSGQKISHAYFPTTVIISMTYMMGNGDSAEIAVVGRGGVVGKSLFFGGAKTSSKTVVQNSGNAYRLSSSHLAAEFDLHAAMNDAPTVALHPSPGYPNSAGGGLQPA